MERKSKYRILESRLGRRLLLQVLLCAVLPLAALGWLALEDAYERLEVQGQQELARETRLTRLTLFERLQILQADLEELVRAGLRNPQELRAAVRHRQRRFHERFAALVLTSGSAPETLHGEVEEQPPELSLSERAHFEEQGVVLAARGSGRNAQLWIGVGRPGIARELWGLIERRYLWQKPLVSEGLGLLVVTPEGQVMHSSFSQGRSGQLWRRLQQASTERFFEWGDEEGRMVASKRRLLMKQRFGTYWTLVATRSRADWYRDIERIRDRTIIFGMLALLMVILVTSDQVRRTLIPIDALRTAIGRVREQRYDEPVRIHSRDEFQELGEAFDGMAERLSEITHERDRVEENLIEARDRAIQAARMETEFLANVSHELRTPMTSIRSFAEILREYADEDPESRREFLDIIVNESERLTRLIEQILSFSKTSSGEANWSFDSIDLCEQLHGVCAGLRPVADSRSIVLEFEHEQDLPSTAGSDDGLRQVWINLITNAIKFSPDGEAVTVRARRDGDLLVVSVTDHGPGIRTEDQKVIFERFRQAYGDILTEKPHGTGLGLTISQAIVRRHLGTLAVESEVGEGSTFSVSLPITDVETLKAAGEQPTLAAAP